MQSCVRRHFVRALHLYGLPNLSKQLFPELNNITRINIICHDSVILILSEHTSVAGSTNFKHPLKPKMHVCHVWSVDDGGQLDSLFLP